MRNILLLLFFLLSFIKIPAQQDLKIAGEICDSLKSIKESDSTILFAEQSSLHIILLNKALQNLANETLKEERNLLNFLNVSNYKISRNIKKNCNLKIPIELYPFPPLTSVVDFDDVFTFEQFKILRDKIRKIRVDHSIDILVLEVDNFYPSDDITTYSFQILDNWKSGMETKKGKIIIVFSKELRQVRISTDQLATMFLDDEFSQEMIDNTILPNFKVGKYYEGIVATINQIEKKL